MTETENVLLVTIGGDEHMYERGRDAIEALEADEQIDEPATIRFANEHQLGEVFNERTYRLLRIIREDEPDSIRETVARDTTDRELVTVSVGVAELTPHIDNFTAWIELADQALYRAKSFGRNRVEK